MQNKLRDAGFEPYVFGSGGDYLLQDDSDGEGSRVVEWRSTREMPKDLLIVSPSEKERKRKADKVD